DKGNLIMINPDMLIVPTDLRKKARIIAETPDEPDTADHGVNVWKGNLSVMEHPFLTDVNGWFLVDSMRLKEYLYWFWRRKPDFADKVEFDDEVSKYKVVGRWSWGWDDFSFLYLNNPS
ncbi:MAG: Mu-like prophage major head subunit gpT family protein, partial [Smithella sp.]